MNVDQVSKTDELVFSSAGAFVAPHCRVQLLQSNCFSEQCNNNKKGIEKEIKIKR